jgi:hypothetical protein
MGRINSEGTQMQRYAVRWNNGYWKLFDSRRYEDVDTFRTLNQAEDAALDANDQGKWRQCNAAAFDTI